MEIFSSSLSKQRHTRYLDSDFAPLSAQPGFKAVRTNESGIMSCMTDPSLKPKIN